jgi:hypothetical protein
MTLTDRKAAIAAYKERKAPAGIYAIRCLATGQQWVGRAADLDKIRNRIWFTLQHGSHGSRSLQTAWQGHSEPDFEFKRVEEINEELAGYLKDRTLKERLIHWAFELGAEPI